MSKGFIFLIKRLLFLFQVLVFVFPGQAFLADVIEAKKEMEGALLAVESVVDVAGEVESFKGIEDKYMEYEKGLRDFQKTVDEYERLGVDVKDFLEFREYEPNSIKDHIRFFKNYIRKTKRLITDASSLMTSPESITASQQIETNRALRALLQDSQTRELRRLRREIAGQKIRLKRRKQEQEFINQQYSYINRHSKGKGFGVFHPFKNAKENKTRKKFLGIF